MRGTETGRCGDQLIRDGGTKGLRDQGTKGRSDRRSRTTGLRDYWFTGLPKHWLTGLRDSRRSEVTDRRLEAGRWGEQLIRDSGTTGREGGVVRAVGDLS